VNQTVNAAIKTDENTEVSDGFNFAGDFIAI
jgi:hypothetical protein